MHYHPHIMLYWKTIFKVLLPWVLFYNLFNFTEIRTSQPHKHITHNFALTILTEHQVYYLSYLVGTHILTLIFSYQLKCCFRLIHTGATSGEKEITVFSDTVVSFWDSLISRKCKFWEVFWNWNLENYESRKGH